MHHKGKFWNMIHLGKKTTNPQLTLSHFLEQELRHRIMDLLSRLEEKSMRSHQHRAHGAHWSSLSPVQQKPEGLHLLQPACRNATCDICISFVHPQHNYEDLHGNFLSAPCLLSARCRFKAVFPAAHGVGTELVAVS